MLTTSWLSIPVEIFFLVNCVAASTPLVRDRDVLRIPHMRSLEVAPLHYLSRRNSSTNLGTASLATQFSNDVLFSIGLDGQISVPGSPNLTATCIECFTTGSASLLSTGFSKDEALLADIPAATAQLLKDPLGFIEEALNVTFEIDLQGLSGHFEIDVSFAAAGTFSIPLLPPITPFGANIDGNEIGFIFSIDLVFSVTGEIDVTTGFDIIWPNTTSIIIDPLKGDIVSIDVSGVQVNPLPFQFHAGSACVQVALRFGLKAGLGINLLGSGANIEAGVFVDAPAYQACANFDSSAPCALGLTQKVFGDAGAFADIAVKIDFVNFKEGPSVVTTFLSADLPSTCLASKTALAIVNTTSSKASITSTALYYNTTSTIKHASATTTKSTLLPSNATINTLTSCESNLLWCPPNLQTTIMVTKPATTTTSSKVPPITIMNAVSITILSSPVASTVQATLANSTTTSVAVQTAGGNFAQQFMNSTVTSVARMTTTLAVSSTGMAGAIASIGGYSSSASSSGSSNGTAVQITSAASPSLRPKFAACAAFFGILGFFL
ncbi:hypothetical protein EG329_001530 [Mollisiaceae sp. DMI_Dod_QoI]|nr:hypothetical protein EG329_001530 [Helotiales sp. DMI_Dod_QoI]